MCAQPGHKFVKGKLVSFVKRDDEILSFPGAGRESRSVDCKKCIHHGKTGALVAVDEGIVLRQAFPQRRGFLDQIIVRDAGLLEAALFRPQTGYYAFCTGNRTSRGW
jgi:hypothetical protein